MANKINIDDVVFELEDKQARSDIQEMNKIKIYDSWEYSNDVLSGFSRQNVSCTIKNNLCFLKGRIVFSQNTATWSSYPVIKNVPKPANGANITYGVVFVDYNDPVFCELGWEEGSSGTSGKYTFVIRTRKESITAKKTGSTEIYNYCYFNLIYPIA